MEVAPPSEITIDKSDNSAAFNRRNSVGQFHFRKAKAGVWAEVCRKGRVTIRALERQKEPSVTPIFYKLRQNTALSRQEISGQPTYPQELLQ
jgi:hypothetical protein